jgi:hypothetical protein
MPKTEIVIDRENHIVSVFAAEPDRFHVIVVDWDSEGVHRRSPNVARVCRGRRTESAFVLDLPVQPLFELAGSDTERAIDIAEKQGALSNREVLPC